ncbi:MAG: GIY-YIG nuclease family protein [Hyphomicrobiales bacterium]|nr:GIY-YIG nuclease family protein [Hyphomicrobiales bacterium]
MPSPKKRKIYVYELLPIGNPKEYKAHFATYNQHDEPLDKFVSGWEHWLGWNRYKGGRNVFSRPHSFSLIRFYPKPNTWLFGGIFNILERHEDSYKIELSDLHAHFIGRLLIEYPGPGTRGRAFNFENHYNKLVVSQILESSYSGEAFCGYENIDHDFRYIEMIVKQGKRDWRAALENVKGVYLITDKRNGKKYVGSAYGQSGIWSRWCCYIGTGHGWNDELTRLIKEHGIDYARENFKFSILEYRAMKTDDQTIIDRETYWKEVLLSRDFGYNKN